MRSFITYLCTILFFGTVLLLLYRLDQKVDETKQVVESLQKQTKAAPTKKVFSKKQSILHVDVPVEPIIRIHRYKPSPYRVTTWAEDHPSWNVMPDRLQWWEKKEPYQLAIALVALDKLDSLHVFLGKQILAVKKDCVPGSRACMYKWLDMREAVDIRLKRFLPTNGSEVTWVAVTMMSSGNLEEFHTTVGQQALKMRRCGKKCAREVVRALDAYFKKVVNDHSGPLIDRNWNKH